MNKAFNWIGSILLFLSFMGGLTFSLLSIYSAVNGKITVTVTDKAKK